MVAKIAQAATRARRYLWDMSPPGPPSRIHRPERIPGVVRVSVALDGALGRTVPHLYSTVLHRSGESEWSAGRERFRTRPGSVGLKVPGEAYIEHTRRGVARFEVIAFDAARVDEARGALDAGPPTPPHAAHFEEDDAAARPFFALHHALLDPSTDDTTLESCLTEALAALVVATSRPSRTQGPHRAAVARARALLDAHFPEAVGLDALAAHARLDKFHLIRAFRDEVGMPPHAYLTHRRVSYAQHLLARGVAQIDVAQRVGLYDQSQLHRHFKRIVGVTPGTFARAAR